MAAPLNPGIAFDSTLFEDIQVNLAAVKRRAETLGTRRTVKKEWQAAWLLRAATCIDLTTLSGDDCRSNVERLCYKAANPIRADLLRALKMENRYLTVGAVCVYSGRVRDAIECLKKAPNGGKISIASVATGFPSGQTSLKSRLIEIEDAVTDGATEIDIVINRDRALNGDWKAVYDELVEMKKTCGVGVEMKSILAVGELGSLENVYKASMVAMMAGSDFIKTSTGKEAAGNASIPVGLVMCRAIRDYNAITGYRVGFKPAGGIRTAKDALLWLILIKEELGDDWLNNKMFRIGASALLVDIERQLFHYVYGRYAAAYEIPLA